MKEKKYYVKCTHIHSNRIAMRLTTVQTKQCFRKKKTTKNSTSKDETFLYCVPHIN